MKTHAHLYHDEEDQDEQPQLSMGVSLFLLFSVTIFVALSAEYLVGSIEGIVETSGLSKTFVGLILLPIVGNAAEVFIVTDWENFFWRNFVSFTRDLTFYSM